MQHGRHRKRHRAVRPAREDDVGGVEGDAQLVGERCCGRFSRVRSRHPVREPPTVLGFKPLLEGFDVAGERRHLRVAGQEVAGVGITDEGTGLRDPA